MRLSARRLSTTPPRLPQQRFRSRPHRFDVGWMVPVIDDAPGQKRRVDVPLHDAAAIPQNVPALGQRLFTACSGRMVVLGHFQFPGVQIAHFAAGSFSLAAQQGDEHTRGLDLDASTETFLESLVGKGFGLNNIAVGNNGICKLALASLALGGQPPFGFGQLNLQCPVPAREDRLPGPFLPGAVRIVAVRVGRPAGAIQRPLQPANFGPRLLYRRAESGQVGRPICDHGNGGRADIEPDDSGAEMLAAFLRRHPFLQELDVPPPAAVEVAPDDAAEFGLTLQGLLLPGIFALRSELGRKDQAAPLDATNTGFPPDPGRIGLGLDRVQRAILALEPGLAAQTETEGFDRGKSPFGNFLGFVRSDPVLPAGGVLALGSEGREGRAGEAELGAELAKGSGPLLLVLEPSGLLPGFRLAHKPLAAKGFAEHGVVEPPRRLETS